MKLFVIKKSGKYVKDFSNGASLTTLGNYEAVEKYYTKEAALEAAKEYGRVNGKGYTVVELA